ncbi:hypothetical protein OBBRIDRAFT_887228 [Obba rivulosa]|uniref:Heterokaryon incompatibility domain-containing protein n=1 Tax=Obba rivulosa TaxID=1052685 RepID=A0A8E2B2K3_9APHY|nr:hypothetical protein OBBRIDRAFT_887228 [Obba rivulosa]
MVDIPASSARLDKFAQSSTASDQTLEETVDIDTTRLGRPASTSNSAGTNVEQATSEIDHTSTSAIYTLRDSASSTDTELDFEFRYCYDKYKTLLPLAARVVADQELASKLLRLAGSIPELVKWRQQDMPLFMLSSLRMLVVVSTELSTQFGTVEGFAIDSGLDEETFMNAMQSDSDPNFTMQQFKDLNILWWKLADFIVTHCNESQRSNSEYFPFVSLRRDLRVSECALKSAHGMAVAQTTVHEDKNASQATTFPERIFLIAKDALWLGGRTGRDLSQPFPNFSCGIRHMILHPAAVLQRRLTFELVEAVVGRSIPEDLLLRSTAGGTVVITTRNLPEIVVEWRERMDLLERTDRDAYKRQYAQARGALEMALEYLQFHLRSGSMSPFRAAAIPLNDITDILFMIAAIGETLTLAMHDLKLQMLSARPMHWNFIAMASPAYDEAMAAEGWCPFTINMLKTKVCVLGYASTCTPFIRDGAGRECHKGCSAVACQVNSIDTAAYSNSHFALTCAGERCVRSKPPLDVVMETLDRNQIPIVQIDTTGSRADEGLKITCSSASLGTPYVAISHVWADGLGSTTEDGLPTCELRRLAIVVHELGKGRALWLDALCIPKDKARRKRAIGLMGETYRGASAVLVVDSGIRSCSITASHPEKLLRVMTSGWVQRLWTLQEASLARNLVFEFSDGLLRVEDLISDVSGASTPAVYELALRLKHIRRRMGPPEDGPRAVQIQKPMLCDVLTDLRWRTTSKAEDETLAIAGLLRIDAAELVDIPPSERMMTLLVRVRNVPSDIIFMPEPHFDKPGFRWAPTTFMHSNSPGMSSDEDAALCTEEGLLGTYHCIIFDTITFRGDDMPWAICGAEDHLCFKLENVNTGVIMNTSEEVTCNAILLGVADRNGMISAATVLIDDSERRNAEEQDLPLECAYVKRMIAFSMDEWGILLDGIDRVVDEKWSGQLKVRLT